MSPQGRCDEEITGQNQCSVDTSYHLRCALTLSLKGWGTLHASHPQSGWLGLVHVRIILGQSGEG